MSDPKQVAPSTPVASSSGIVGVAGTQPLPWFLDLNGDGIADWQQKGFRDAVANALYWLVTRLVPGAAQSLTLKQMAPHIRAIIQAGSK